jgi:glucosamine-6-phosphate deaminase
MREVSEESSAKRGADRSAEEALHFVILRTDWDNAGNGVAMLVLLKSSYEEMSGEAARIVASAVRGKPDVTLGLATGSTTLGMYRELVRLRKEEGLDFSRVVTFNLDEYLGLSGEHPQSFHRFMRENFFDHVNVDPAKIHIPDGTIGEGYEEYCLSYERAIREAGGIDLQILGIGRNGHIGFNEPTSSFGSRTRLKVLTSETIEDNRKFFAPGEEVPECAITMGIGTILEAKKIVLLATGAAKAETVAEAIEGPITASVTASCLQLHEDVTFVIDEAAGKQLKQRDYYRRVMEMTARFTPNRLS